MKYLASLTMLAFTLFWMSAAKADQCDASHAQDLAREGYHQLDLQRWSDAKDIAGALVLMSQQCDDVSVKVPAVVHSAYIGATALHGLGSDAKAAEAVKAGLLMLDILQKDGHYATLYDAMEPRFLSLQRKLKPTQ